MNKIIAGYTVLFFILSMLSSFIDGAVGAASATDLTAGITATDNVLNVTDTEGFLSVGGVLMAGNEKMSYTGSTPLTFTGVNRGIEGTEATAHAIGDMVYAEDAGILNYALGFSVISTAVPGGIASVAMIPFNFLTITVPKLVLWDYSFFSGDFIIIRYILMAVSIGFVIYLSFMAVNTILGVLRKVV